MEPGLNRRVLSFSWGRKGPSDTKGGRDRRGLPEGSPGEGGRGGAGFLAFSFRRESSVFPRRERPPVAGQRIRFPNLPEIPLKHVTPPETGVPEGDNWTATKRPASTKTLESHSEVILLRLRKVWHVCTMGLGLAVVLGQAPAAHAGKGKFRQDG